MAKHVLRHLAPVIAEALEMEEAVAKCLSYSPGVEGAMLSRLDGERSLCNMCSTSISNLHGACSECEWDFCTYCLSSQTAFPLSCLNPDCNSTTLLQVNSDSFTICLYPLFVNKLPYQFNYHFTHRPRGTLMILKFQS